MDKGVFKTIIVVSFFGLSLSSCVTKNQVQVSADVYDDSETKIQTQIETSEKNQLKNRQL